MIPLNICGNTYIIPDGYSVEPITLVSYIIVGNHKIYVNSLYRVTKYEDIGGVEIEKMMFDDIYLFEYGGHSHVFIRRVLDGGKIIRKHFHIPCYSDKEVDLGKIFKSLHVE